MARTVILISADIEWHAVCEIFPNACLHSSPYGEWFYASSKFSESLCKAVFSELGEDQEGTLIFFHGGWGKIAAAGSTQYVIDRWLPDLLINLGTCGGFEGQIERGQIVLAEKTIVYDIIEQMGDYDEHIDHYSTRIDLGWLRGTTPIPIYRTLLVSGDRDLVAEEIPFLREHFGAVAGDWESGAIAWVADRNRTPLLILRGVTDLVGNAGGEAYGNIEVFTKASQIVMTRLIDSLPGWLALL
jgi:adenosylhomocysteine nucleosidase